MPDRNIIILRSEKESIYSKMLEHLITSKLNIKQFYIYQDLPDVNLIFIFKTPDKELEKFCAYYSFDMLDTHNITRGDLELIAKRIIKIYDKIKTLFIKSPPPRHHPHHL